MDKEIIEDCLYDFSVWMFRRNYIFTRAERDAFFLERCIDDPDKFFELAHEADVHLYPASLGDLGPETTWLTPFQKLSKILWR